ncbi:MAG: hypothetical protein ACUVV6_02915 [Thermoplasmatota archaeon]
MGEVPGRSRGRNGRRALSGDMRALEGIFDELPAFLAVVLGLAVFFVSLYSVAAVFSEWRASAELGDECERLYIALRNWEPMLKLSSLSLEPIPGHLSASRLGSLNASAPGKELAIPNPYNITVRDLRTGEVWGFGEPAPAGAATARVSGPVVIVTDGGRRDPGELSVVMWR